MRYLVLACCAIGCGSVNSVDDQVVDGGGDDAGDSSDAAADAPIDATIEPRHTVFVSSTTFIGDQGGIDGFSAQCQTLADSAGLQGTFVALLHLRSNPLSVDRVAIEGPVFNTGGELVALDATEFYSGTLRAGNRFTEAGGDPADTIAWIGTPTGDIAVCGDWGSTAASGGQVNVTGTTWLTASSTGNCTLNRSVQCISL